MADLLDTPAGRADPDLAAIVRAALSGGGGVDYLAWVAKAHPRAFLQLLGLVLSSPGGCNAGSASHAAGAGPLAVVVRHGPAPAA